jgi:protein-S-isoprenylcysteine O-methyltransferase Ste14
MMLISQHEYSVIAGLVASIVYASDVPHADKKLIEKFGESYLEYMGQVPALNFITGIFRHLRS